MRVPSRIMGILGLIIMLMLGGCTDTTTEEANEGSIIDHMGFTANVSGAVNGEVAGTGVVTYLPPKEEDTVTGFRPGYFLIANLNTETMPTKEIIINFRIPDVAQPGHYDLTTPNPLKLGEEFDVQVETVEEGKVNLYQSNTEGTLKLDTFAPNRTFPENSTIKGTFEFETENTSGNRITASGTFDFPTSKKVVVRR
jgi:hypothetical protein